MPKVDIVSAEQAENFSILRRPQAASDVLPESRDGVFDGGRVGEPGLNPALARRPRTPVGDVWVVPGDGHIALYTGSMVATRTAIVARQGTVIWASQDGKGIVHGLVPDGVDEVTLFDSDNASVSALVNDNVWGAVLDGHFRSLRFIGPAGTVELGPWS